MMKNNQPLKIETYAKFAQLFLGILGFFYVLHLGQAIVIPLIFATLIAILLNPIVNFLSRKGINRIIGITITIFSALILLSALAYFVGFQIASFSDSLPEFKQNFNLLAEDFINWISDAFKIDKLKINSWITKIKSEGLTNSTVVIGQTAGAMGGLLIVLVLMPVYIFLILFYESLLLDFISQLFEKDKHKEVADVLSKTKSLIQSYLIGLLIELVIVAALNSLGLFIIGIKYAILLGIIAAILNIIPYIGGIIAIGLTMSIAIAIKSPASALWVFVAHLIVQLIDNYFIMPKIVASKVKINALVSIVVVLIGGALWGVAGMFLSIPLTAIVKVISDHVEQLQPFGFLLGDNQPNIGRSIFNFKKPVKKNSAKLKV
jgi:predicted PurR-regulated permease PerM